MPDHLRKINFVFFISWLIALHCLGQNRFACRGNFFISFSDNNQTAVYEGKIDPITNSAIYDILPAPPMNFLLNAIGYRSSDNFIYGVKSTGLVEDLVRLDADGTPFFITTLYDLKDNLQYPAGDISPDGKYLVLLGAEQFGGGGFTEDLSIVDLDSPDFEITSFVPVANSFTFTDVAFDPTDGQLFGFDNESNTLVLIEYSNGTATFQTPFPSSPTAEYIGAIFFDVVGNLYGYGTPIGSFSQNTLFEIDKFTGEITIVEEGPTVQRSDGCSCPYTIEIDKTVSPKQTVPCTPITYQINILNATGEAQSGLVFEDQLPPGFTILEVNIPFDGEVTSSVGTNLLLIENIVLPSDTSTITIIAEAANGVSGIQANQANINGMSLLLGAMVLSDDPTTDATNDATNIMITPFDINYNNIPTNICEGDTLLLDPDVPWAVDFLWSDGSTDTSLLVTESGNYGVTISSSCDSVIYNFEIEGYELASNLPDFSQILQGDSILLDPMIQPYPDLQYDWTSNLDNNFCDDCPAPTVQPLLNALYFLHFYTSSGCESFDTTFVKVIEETDNIYMPNVFSPDENGYNDVFYPQSKETEKVLTFRVFTRWGELVFENNNVFTNDQSIGWNGSFKGNITQGIYLYFLEIEREDGRIEIVTGDVLLIGRN